jgi:hypothetical protein
MQAVSAKFAEKVLGPGVASSEARYRKALFALLITQTSCFRYWGDGAWTSYGMELCQRALDIFDEEF